MKKISCMLLCTLVQIHPLLLCSIIMTTMHFKAESTIYFLTFVKYLSSLNLFPDLKKTVS